MGTREVRRVPARGDPALAPQLFPSTGGGDRPQAQVPGFRTRLWRVFSADPGQAGPRTPWASVGFSIKSRLKQVTSKASLRSGVLKF